MKVLVVGSGGREHALAWLLKRSPSVSEVLAAPGNPGLAELGRCFPVAADDADGLLRLAREEGVDLTVVGPEAPLAAGLADRFARQKRLVFGPTAAAARLESSKAFAKRLMQKHRIPTASFRVFDDAAKALAHVRAAPPPLVVKADGLAAGKGVFVCGTTEEALAAVEAAMTRKAFGEAGARVVVEECLTGPELSVMALTDGETLFPLPPCRDHKRALDGDRGPNTGGMGAFCPVPGVSEDLLRRVEREILVPVVHAMRVEKCPFAGLLYAGLMLTPSGPKVLEFNVRFGDPETQVLVRRLAGDFGALLLSVARGRLDAHAVSVSPEAAVCVVACAGGYPGPSAKGVPIAGIETAARREGVVVFQAGTARDARDRLVTAGGRVLAVSAVGADVAAARARAYAAAADVRFEGIHYRADIALSATRPVGA